MSLWGRIICNAMAASTANNAGQRGSLFDATPHASVEPRLRSGSSVTRLKYQFAPRQRSMSEYDSVRNGHWGEGCFLGSIISNRNSEQPFGRYT